MTSSWSLALASSGWFIVYNYLIRRMYSSRLLLLSVLSVPMWMFRLFIVEFVVYGVQLSFHCSNYLTFFFCHYFWENKSTTLGCRIFLKTSRSRMSFIFWSFLLDNTDVKWSGFFVIYPSPSTCNLKIISCLVFYTVMSYCHKLNIHCLLFAQNVFSRYWEGFYSLVELLSSPSLCSSTSLNVEDLIFAPLHFYEYL